MMRLVKQNLPDFSPGCWLLGVDVGCSSPNQKKATKYFTKFSNIQLKTAGQIDHMVVTVNLNTQFDRII